MKVKFTKLAALLLAGVALLAAGCTDYEVDIQKVDKKVDELAVKTAADLDAQVNALKAMIAAVEQNYKDADAALKQALEAQIADLNNLKLDKSTFETYKKETAETLKLMNQALQEIKDNYATKAELEAAMAEISAKFDDYVLKETFDEFVALAATKAELEALKTKLEEELADAKEEMQQKLTEAIAGVEEKIEALDERVTILETAVADIIDELAFAEGDLQGYIDDADAATLEAAMDYTDEWIYALADYIDELMFDVWGAVTVLQERMQSIVYVPDYDDLKITVNMAYVSQEVAAEEFRAQGGQKNVAVVDQPFKVQYKFLPAKYAAWVAENYEDLLVYDVKPVNTRAEEVEEENAPALQILAAEYDEDTVEETGIITFTVLPVNIASAQFAANGLKPNYSLEFYDQNGSYLQAGSAEEGYDDELYLGGYRVPENFGINTWLIGVWDYDSLMAYEARTAFAASMRMKYQEGVGTGVYHYYYGDIADEYYPEYNEIASTYNVLYPDATEIEILPDPYKPELDEDGNVVTDEEGNTVLVKAVPEYQYLPYSSLRENPVGEKEDQDPKGYRIILDQAVPGIEIDGNVYTLEDAAKKGYVLPAIETKFDEFTYEQGTAEELDEENFVETAQVYAEIEMNPAKSAAERKLAVGNVITGWYHFETAIGNTPFFGQVEITKPLGEVKLTAEIKWEYSQDADTDHEVYYNDADPLYTHVEVPVAIDEDDAKALEDNLAVTLADFAGLEPTKLAITYVDAETGETVEATDVKIENVKIEDGELFADFVDFEWDQTYTVVAEYELEAALITVTATVTTVDRNRELIEIKLDKYSFDLNGEAYDAETDTYESEPLEFQEPLFNKFVENGIINQLDPKDFEDADAFVGVETDGKEGHLTVVTDAEGNSIYLVIADDNVTIIATSPELKEIMGTEQFIYVTTYTGQLVKVIVPVDVNLPGYDFLHLRYYTFNTKEESADFITKRDLVSNEGDVVWWSQVNPSYFNDKPEGEPAPQTERISNRYCLADYDVAYINLAELAFNVVDEKDVPLTDEQIEEAYLVVDFKYKENDKNAPKDGDNLPKVDQINPDYLLYESLWIDNTIFYYRTNAFPYIKMIGTLAIKSGETLFELPTRFDTPKAPQAAGVSYTDKLDYSEFALARWTPFQEATAEGYTMVLDENKIYRIPLFKGMSLKDNRPNGVEYDVIADGEWVEGNVTNPDATKADGGNGYLDGVLSWEAYHIDPYFTYDDLNLPSDLRKLLSVVYTKDNGETFMTEEEVIAEVYPNGVPAGEKAKIPAEYVPYVQYDYTSEVQFHGVVTIPVVVLLENPWQDALRFSYDFVIKGYGD